MGLAIDTGHGCPSGGKAARGLVPVQQKASSACCGAVLNVGGTDAAGYTCSACSKPTTKVMGDQIAHWTCDCGQKRQQLITRATDEAAQ